MKKRITFLSFLAFLLLVGACAPATTAEPDSGMAETDALAEPVVVYRSPT